MCELQRRKKKEEIRKKKEERRKKKEGRRKGGHATMCELRCTVLRCYGVTVSAVDTVKMYLISQSVYTLNVQLLFTHTLLRGRRVATKQPI